MTAKTGEASTVHEPIGKPGGPGLWHHKGLQLPAYIQHVAHHLIAQGHDESRAIEMAVGLLTASSRTGPQATTGTATGSTPTSRQQQPRTSRNGKPTKPAHPAGPGGQQ